MVAAPAPGVAASATHGVIRVGHAVRALLTDGEDGPHVTELAHGLAYWAARWQPIPGTPAPAESAPIAGEAKRQAADLTPAAALAAVPRIASQSGGFRDRLPGWPDWPDGVPR